VVHLGARYTVTARGFSRPSNRRARVSRHGCDVRAMDLPKSPDAGAQAGLMSGEEVERGAANQDPQPPLCTTALSSAQP